MLGWTVAVLVRISITVKGHHEHGNSYKVKHLIESVAYSFKSLAHCHHGREHGSVQANMAMTSS